MSKHYVPSAATLDRDLDDLTDLLNTTLDRLDARPHLLTSFAAVRAGHGPCRRRASRDARTRERS